MSEATPQARERLLEAWWASGIEMTIAGAIVGGATYLIGLALPT
jgi:hypothetical protein